jgi:predicted nicotinamide N-methyase
MHHKVSKCNGARWHIHAVGSAYARAMTAEQETLVRSATEWAVVPFVPEVTLRTAAEPFGLWDRTERDAPPFWAFPWAGGQGLARYILDHPETVAGHHVLDVASGSGLVAIAAAKAGARTALAADIDENALIAIALNAAANNTPQVVPRSVDLAAASLTVSCLGIVSQDSGQDTADSGTAAADLVATLAADVFRAPDVVLAGDVFYQRDLAAMALTFLKAARRAGAAVFVADPARAFVPRAELTPVLTYEIPVLPVLEDTQVKTVTIYSLP